MGDYLTSIGQGELMAVLSSLFFSGTLISLHQGMRYGTPLAALLFVNTIVSQEGTDPLAVGIMQQGL